jgi:hypothetical protein
MFASLKTVISVLLPILALCTALIAHPQSGRPAFEVAAIKPSPRDGGQAGINRSAEQFTMSLRLINYPTA